MRRCCARFRCRILTVVAICSSFFHSSAYAVTTSWIANGGDFTTAANWTSGVPDSDDVAVFHRGFVAYEVNFPGGFIFDPPTNYAIDALLVRTNEVGFVHANVPFQSNPSLSVLNPGFSIVVGEEAGNVAILNMALRSLSGTNASIGRAGGANGTLNVGGTFSLSGLLNVGEFGTGTMNVTGGATVTSANGFIGPYAGSNGQVTVSGAGSTWTNSNSLTVGGGFNTSGRLDVNDGGVVSATGGLLVNDRLTGNGTIQGNVQNSGIVAPGVSPGPSTGTLHIDGNYAGIGGLLIELAAANSFDKLDIDGNLTLGDGNITGGYLYVSLLGGYSPAVGATFDILDWTGTQNGTFFSVTLPPLAAGLVWNTLQLYTDGVLSVAVAVPGDYNGNGTVDAADYVVWRKTDGTQQGYNTWRAHFGQTGGSGSGASANAAVPEPASCIPIIVLAACLFNRLGRLNQN